MTLSNRAPFRLPTGISSVQIATRVVATQKQFLQSVLLSLSGHAEVERTGDQELAGAQGNGGVGAGEEAGGQGEAGGQEEPGGQGEAGGQASLSLPFSFPGAVISPYTVTLTCNP
jgi:hypothetical protein